MGQEGKVSLEDAANKMLADAIKENDPVQVELAIKMGADVNKFIEVPAPKNSKQGEKWHSTHLLQAVVKPNINGKIVELLLAACANPNPDLDVMPPLTFAVIDRNIKVMTMILNAEADANAVFDYETAIQRAMRMNFVDGVRLLAERNADLRVFDDNGNTPMHFAINCGDVWLCKLLLEKNPFLLEIEDRFGRTPLMLAANNGDMSIAKLFIVKGHADVNYRNSFGETALLSAILAEDLGMCKMLLHFNADPFIKDGHGRDPLDYAMAAQSPEIRALFEDIRSKRTEIKAMARGTGIEPVKRKLAS